MHCPNCQSDRVKRNGRTNNNQRWFCHHCGRSFTGNPPGRPQSEDRVVAVTFSKPILATLSAIAFERDLTISQYLEEVLIEHFTE